MQRALREKKGPYRVSGLDTTTNCLDEADIRAANF